MIRNSQIGAYVYPVVPPEYTNWRDEQRAWRESCVLFDQSHHMVDIYIEGPDALKMLTDLAINSFAKFPPNRAKQFIPCGHSGHVIGDGILFHLEQNKLVFVGRAPSANWIQFHAATGGYNVNIVKDDRSPSRPHGKPVTPHFLPLSDSGTQRLEADREAERRTGSGHQVLHHGRHQHRRAQGPRAAPRHGRSSGTGDLGTLRRRRRSPRERSWKPARSSTCTWSAPAPTPPILWNPGWIPSPLPAVYTGDKMKSYREWLPANGYEATCGLAGSFYSNNVEDYYLTPYELGYGPFVKFDHDFIGREALEKIAGQAASQESDLRLEPRDVAKVFSSMFEPGDSPTSTSICRFPTTPRRPTTR